jgi:hypothetical protein
MEAEVPATNEGPCTASYEYDLPDADLLGPNYDAEETAEEPLAVTEEKKTDG